MRCGQAGKERRVADLDGDLGVAVLARGAERDLAAQMMHDEVQAVADAEDRHAEMRASRDRRPAHRRRRPTRDRRRG